tara:strand:+ start:308 stop:523 length:216 start_codon:yes stop_codon:yes gene_type:complete
MLVKYFKKLDKLQEEAEHISEAVLQEIDLKELIKSPREYLTTIGSKFIFDNTTLLKKGVTEGTKLSEKFNV